MKRQLPIFLICAVAALALFAVSRPADIPFERHALDLGANEACAIADINGDGRQDVVSGENWFENPGTLTGTWKRHHFRDLPFQGNYIDDFSDLILDVNADGKADVATSNLESDTVSVFLSR